jgi:hypothetical protein
VRKADGVSSGEGKRESGGGRRGGCKEGGREGEGVRRRSGLVRIFLEGKRGREVFLGDLSATK